MRAHNDLANRVYERNVDSLQLIHRYKKLFNNKSADFSAPYSETHLYVIFNKSVFTNN